MSGGAVVVCVSIAVDPARGRRVLAPGDAVALELALRLGRPTVVVHAGASDEPALRQCLRMGAARVDVLPMEAGDDILDALVAYLRAAAPSLIVCGARAGSGRASGLLPHRLAARLGRTAVAEVRGVEAAAGGWLLSVRLGRGRTGRVTMDEVVAIADPAAARPRYGSHAAGRAGSIQIVTPSPAPMPDGIVIRPARVRPAPVRGLVGATATERLESIGGVARAGGSARRLEPEAAAETILARITARGFGPLAAKSEPGP